MIIARLTHLPDQDTGMYNSQPARHLAQTLAVNSQYIPAPYEFSGYHHVPGVGDPSTGGWNSVYAPRDEYPFLYSASSSSAGQVSFSNTEVTGTPTAAGGGSFTPFNFISGQDSFGSRRRSQESIRPATSGGIRYRRAAQPIASDVQCLPVLQYLHFPIL